MRVLDKINSLSSSGNRNLSDLLALARRYRAINRRLNDWYPEFGTRWRAQSRFERVRAVVDLVRQEVDLRDGALDPCRCCDIAAASCDLPTSGTQARHGLRCTCAGRLLTISILVCCEEAVPVANGAVIDLRDWPVIDHFSSSAHASGQPAGLCERRICVQRDRR